MKSLQEYIYESRLLEELDVDNLEYKVNFWYGQNEVDKTAFYQMMQRIISENPNTLEALDSIIKDCGVKYIDFIQFAMNNVNGSQNFEPLYIMKKIVDILKGNKSLTWEL